MKKIIVLTVALILVAALLNAQGSKQVFQELFDVDGVTYPNPTEQGAITFRAWIVSRPEHMLTQNSTGSQVGMQQGRFMIQVNAGNFPGSAGAPVDWTAGEVLRIEIIQAQRTLWAANEIVLTHGSGGLFPAPIALRDPPIALFDTNDEDIVTATASILDGYNPDGNGVYRANNWEDERYWVINFSTTGYGEIRLTSKLRRQFSGSGPGHPRGPKYFQTYFSLDGGESWALWGNPEIEGEFYHELPDSEGWVNVVFNFPVSGSWQETVMVKWMNIWDETNQNGWAEIKDVVVTGFESEEPPYQLYPPNNLTYELEEYDVHLSWGAPSPTEVLSYDHNTATGGYYFPGYTMATRMTPGRPAQILKLMYYTLIDEGDNDFNAEIYSWSQNRPTTQPLHTERVIAADNDWVYVDVSEQQIFVTADFVVGFGSINETTFLAYDENYNNGRSWDFEVDANTWYQHNEAYIIRALVLYEDGEPGLLSAVNEEPKKTTRVSHNRTGLQRATKSGAAIKSEKLTSLTNNSLRYREDIELIGYNVYRNDERVNDVMVTQPFYTDENLQPGNVYTYYVTAVYTYNQESGPSTNEVRVSIVKADGETIPHLVTQLHRNYPNPFNPSTTIKFSIAENDDVRLDIFNSKGQKVVTLVDDFLSAGNHSFLWDGRDGRNREVGSGVYFYRLRKGQWSSTEKMLLVK